MLITAGIISFTPFISSYAAINDQYNWNYSSENITQTDLSSYFKIMKAALFYLIPIVIAGLCMTWNMPPIVYLQTPLIKYMMHFGD